MSIIRNGNVALSNLRKAPVALSNLRNIPVVLSNLRDPPKKGRVALSILGVYTHLDVSPKGNYCHIYFRKTFSIKMCGTQSFYSIIGQLTLLLVVFWEYIYGDLQNIEMAFDT